MRIHLFLASMLVAANAFSTEVYRWVDESGRVQFGDRPPTEDAEPVKLPPTSTYAPRVLPATILPPKASDEPAAVAVYRRIEVVRPSDDDTLRDNTGRVDVAFRLDPPLQPGHSLAVVMDDKPVFSGLTTMAVTLTNVDRGTHRVEVRVLDAGGAEVTASAPVTFHLHRTTISAPKPPRPAPAGG